MVYFGRKTNSSVDIQFMSMGKKHFGNIPRETQVTRLTWVRI